jgi:hypothetical protein
MMNFVTLALPNFHNQLDRAVLRTLIEKKCQWLVCWQNCPDLCKILYFLCTVRMKSWSHNAPHEKKYLWPLTLFWANALNFDGCHSYVLSDIIKQSIFTHSTTCILYCLLAVSLGCSQDHQQAVCTKTHKIKVKSLYQNVHLLCYLPHARTFIAVFWHLVKEL